MKTILLVGKMPIFLSGIRNVIHDGASASFSVTKLCVKELELSQILRHQDFHYLMLDLCSEQRISVNIRQILHTTSYEKTIVFGSWEEAKVIKCLFKLGVNGYLLNNTQEADILEALLQLETEAQFLTREFRKKLSDQSIGLNSKKKFRITPREKEVLNLIVEEYTTREIAEKLFISSCTAETHRLNLINKFGVKNTAGLVREAVFTNLVSI